MALIKTAAQILGGKPRPVDVTAQAIAAGLVKRTPGPGRPKGNRKCERVAGCTNPHRGKGLCQKHLDAERRWGNPLHVYVPARWGEQCGCPQHRRQEPRNFSWTGN